jgi:hypothetical protein
MQISCHACTCPSLGAAHWLHVPLPPERQRQISGRPGSKRRRGGQQEVSQVGQPEPDDVSRLDDFQVLSERRRVMEALAFLTQEYKRLTAEMTSRETLRWMVAP